MDVTRMMRPLLGLTLASLLLAFIAVLGDRPVNAVAPPRILLPDYAQKLTQATQLDITHGQGLSGTQTMRFERVEGQWQLPQRQGYPANQELVTETLLALADVKAVSARTAQAKWHRTLGLTVPEDLGKAVRFRVYDGEGSVLTSLLLGNEEASEAEAAQDVKTYGVEQRQFYVRREDEMQSWLARGRLPRNSNIAAWIDESLPKGALERLQRVSFGTGDKTVMTRVTQDSWSLAGGPDWLAGFAMLRPEDVTRADAIEFATARPMQLVYSDGLVLRYENVGAATVIWSRITASTEAQATADIKAQAAAINARFGGWALRFPADQAPILLPGKGQLGDRP